MAPQVGLEYNMTVSALNTCNCPLLQVSPPSPSQPLTLPPHPQNHSSSLLQELNLSFVANLTDSAIHKLLSAPRDSRPGAANTRLLPHILSLASLFTILSLVITDPHPQA